MTKEQIRKTRAESLQKSRHHKIEFDLIESAVTEMKLGGKWRTYSIEIVGDYPTIWKTIDTRWEKYGPRSYPRYDNNVRVMVSRRGRKLLIVGETSHRIIQLPPAVRVPAVRWSGIENALHYRSESGKLYRELRCNPEPRTILCDHDPKTGRIWYIRKSDVSKTLVRVGAAEWRQAGKIAQKNGWTRCYDRKLGHGWEDKNGEQYHYGAFRRRGDIMRAQSAFTARVREKRQTELRKRADALLRTRGWEVLVTLEDSHAAGNCRIGTAEFAAEIRRKYQYTGDMLDAQTILLLRDDDYTRRACRVAALRHNQ